MKLIARIILILAAASAVVGLTLALAGSPSARAGAPQRRAPAQDQAGAANAFPGNAGGEQRRGDRPGGFERGGGRGPSLFGVGEMLKDLVIIALIVAVVAPITRLLKRRQRSESDQRPNADPPVMSSPV